MRTHMTALVFVATLTSTAAARADETPRTRYSPATGIALTSVGGSLILSAPITILMGAGIAAANQSFGVIGPFILAAFGNVCAGLGMIIPGIVMLASHKRALPQPREPIWHDGRTDGPQLPRVVAAPVLRLSF
jgi:hypothetical protein